MRVRRGSTDNDSEIPTKHPKMNLERSLVSENFVSAPDANHLEIPASVISQDANARTARYFSYSGAFKNGSESPMMGRRISVIIFYIFYLQQYLHFYFLIF